MALKGEVAKRKERLLRCGGVGCVLVKVCERNGFGAWAWWKPDRSGSLNLVLVSSAVVLFCLWRIVPKGYFRKKKRKVPPVGMGGYDTRRKTGFVAIFSGHIHRRGQIGKSRVCSACS